MAQFNPVNYAQFEMGLVAQYVRDLQFNSGGWISVFSYKNNMKRNSQVFSNLFIK